MPIIQRFSAIRNGGVVFTGNTLGLSKAANTNTAGTLGSIGAFISKNTALQVNNLPQGTTLDYTQNGSSAELQLPPGSTVLYAELVWGGLFRLPVNNISALTDNAVTFTLPSGAIQVSPDVLTRQNFNITNNGVIVGFYVRSANVTTQVRAAGGGTYTVGGVPSLIEALDQRTSETNHAGWTLAVVYEDPTQPLRDLTLWCGGAVVSPSTGDTDVSLTGFITPAVQPITGKIFVSAQEGDAVISGDRMLFGRTIAALTSLSGVNNPIGNFFSSQINSSDGTLNTLGTFGNRNANAAAGTNTSACRQGWDITAVDVSALLEPGMTTAVARFTTAGDLYVPNCLAMQIDSLGARLEVVKSADKSFAQIGEEVRYTLTISNEGSISADNVTVTDVLPAEVELVAGSVTVNGAPYAGGFPISVGQIAAGGNAIVAFSVRALSVPQTNPFFDIASAEYTFDPFPGYTVTAISDSDPVSTYITVVRMSVVKSVDKAFAAQGDELIYTSLITNDGNLPLINVVFTDAPPIGTAFVPGSVTIDGVSYPAYDPSTGVPLPAFVPGRSVEVTFKVTIN